VREVDAELALYEADLAATAALRAEQRAARRGWLAEDAEDVARRYRAGELDALDLVRHYGVIVDWRTGELFETTTTEFRAMLARRAVPHWS
jgi:N-methylhydantoinase B